MNTYIFKYPNKVKKNSDEEKLLLGSSTSFSYSITGNVLTAALSGVSFDIDVTQDDITVNGTAFLGGTPAQLRTLLQAVFVNTVNNPTVASGSFTSNDGKTVTVVNGLISSIV